MSPAAAPPPNDLRPLDDLDLALVRELSADARITNAALAERVGVAASTCLTRVRGLLDRGVLRGFYADVDLPATGLGLRAVVAVSLQSSSRGALPDFARSVGGLPGVQHVYFLGGADDFLIDLAVEDTTALRTFVVQLSERPEVASTQTSIVFDFVRGGGIRLEPASSARTSR
jgi:DNA-binding Lrp family transcriptional regulator